MSLPHFRMFEAESSEARLRRVTDSFVLARQTGQCPVATILLSELLKTEQLSRPVPSATTLENAMARMLCLANYALHDYAVRALAELKFPAHATRLANIPPLKHRDDLPPAQAVLRDVLEELSKAHGTWDESDRHQVARNILRNLHGSFYELDGAVVKVQVVMSDFLRTLTIGEHLINKHELVDTLLAIE
jgi:hypothetical protein